MLTLIEAMALYGISFEEAVMFFGGKQPPKLRQEETNAKKCESCGAPLTLQYVCEYCGTIY